MVYAPRVQKLSRTGDAYESDIGGSSCLKRTAIIDKPGSQSTVTNCKGTANEGVPKITESLGKPVKIKLSLTPNDDNDDDIASQQHCKAISIDHLK